MNTVKIETNEKHLVNLMKLAFTSETTFLAELMQNARRSGASYVKFTWQKFGPEIIVEDDGSGIENMQTLLSVAESGWPDDIKESENPYGIGFLSALFAAEHARIESNGKMIEFNTASALNFEDIDVVPGHVSSGTRITLTGVDKTLEYEDSLRRYARGFPIEVIYNGMKLPRPHALKPAEWEESLEFDETPVGLISLREKHDTPTSGAVTRHIGCRNVTLYLQGLPVYSPRATGITNVVHLDAKKFKGRLPDRDCLIDEIKALKSVGKTIENLWRGWLRKKMETVEDQEIAKIWYGTLKHWGCLELLNNVPYLPCDVVSKISDYPSLLPHAEFVDSFSETPIAKKLFTSGAPKIALVDPYLVEDDPAHPLMYLRELDIPVLTGDLHEDHWIYGYTVEVDPENVSVKMPSDTSEDTFTGNWGGVNVYFCDHVAMDGPFGSTVITDDAFTFARAKTSIGATSIGPYASLRIVVPAGETSGKVVTQLNSFADEWDRLNEDLLEDEKRWFRSFLLRNKPDGLALAFRELVEGANVQYATGLRGHTFQVTVKSEYMNGSWLEVTTVE